MHKHKHWPGGIGGDGPLAPGGLPGWSLQLLYRHQWKALSRVATFLLKWAIVLHFLALPTLRPHILESYELLLVTLQTVQGAFVESFESVGDVTKGGKCQFEIQTLNGWYLPLPKVKGDFDYDIVRFLPFFFFLTLMVGPSHLVEDFLS